MSMVLALSGSGEQQFMYTIRSTTDDAMQSHKSSFVLVIWDEGNIYNTHY